MRVRSSSRRHRVHLETVLPLEDRCLLATITVNSALDTNVRDDFLTLREAIMLANGDLAFGTLTPAEAALVLNSPFDPRGPYPDGSPAPDNIRFAIPASYNSMLDVPAPGFDPATQTWKVELNSPLPALKDQVTIDAYTQAHFPIPYVYSVNDAQQIDIQGHPTGGNFTLDYSYHSGPGGTGNLLTETTAPIAFNATSQQIQSALEALPHIGSGNVQVTGGPLPNRPITVQFINERGKQAIPSMLGHGDGLTGGQSPQVLVGHIKFGGRTEPPALIQSVPNTIPALRGNNAQIRVILSGAAIDRGMYSNPIGFQVQASHTIIRGFAIEGFDVGVKVDPGNHHNPHDGVLIQGNSIGMYFLYPVDPDNGSPITGAGSIVLSGVGNTAQGVILGATNATLGGGAPQENNVIVGNGAQGVWVQSGAVGNQILGNQIGVIGPVDTYYAAPGNGAEGILIEGLGTSSSPAVGGSTNVVSANVISANFGDGVHIVGPDAIDNRVIGNYIGVAPGGGYRFGSGDPGNRGDGVRIDDASGNVIGGLSSSQRNVIAANHGAGVRIWGALATENLVASNYIGLIADGSAVLGNSFEGVRIEEGATHNTVGPANVISGNLRGVLIQGDATSYNLVQDNRIGTDKDGNNDLGNAKEGVRIEAAPLNTVRGDGKGSQLISGNDAGLAIVGATATNNTVQGNWIGLDITGTVALGNSKQGVLIENAPSNQIGGVFIDDGSTNQNDSNQTNYRNSIVGNHWGLVLVGPEATGDRVQGNEILKSELDGVLIYMGASGNLIGGLDPGVGNIIRDNYRDGVRVLAGNNNAILSNSISYNTRLGIDLGGDGATSNGDDSTPNSVLPRIGPNNLQRYPDLSVVLIGGGQVHVEGSLWGTPGSTYTIQFFENTTAGRGGTAQGETLIQTITRTADLGGSGLIPINLDFSANVPADHFITATATDQDGNTSEFSLALQTSSVQFEKATYIVREDAGLATITVKRTGPPGAVIQALYSTADSTARADQNYRATSGTLILQPNEMLKTFTIPILHDPRITGDLTVNLTLSMPATGAVLGTSATAVLKILDVDSRVVHFTTSTASVNEDAGSLILTVQRDGDTGAEAVNYQTVPLTAVPGVDFQPLNGTLHFAPGQLTRQIVLPVFHNQLSTADHTLSVILSANPDSLTPSAPDRVLITINDVDQVRFHFDKPSYEVSQSAGSITLKILRSGNMNSSVTVDLETIDGTAKRDVDYTRVSTAIKFERGETEQSVTVPILNRNLESGSAEFQVQLTASGSYMTPPNATVAILHDRAVTVRSVVPVIGSQGITAIQVIFSRSVDAKRAIQLFNYENAVFSAGRDRIFGSLDDVPVRLVLASYDDALNRVTLVPITPLAFDTAYQLRINRVITPVVGPGVADDAGNLLDGNGDGRAGGVYQTTIGPVARPAVALPAAPASTPLTTPAPKPVVVPTPKPVVTPTPKPVVVPIRKPVVVPTPKPVTIPAPKPVVVPTPKPATPGSVLFANLLKPPAKVPATPAVAPRAVPPQKVAVPSSTPSVIRPVSWWR